MGRAHNLNSTNTSLTLQRRVAETRVNGKDWGRIQTMYSPAVVDSYRRLDFAQRDQNFASVLRRGLLREVIERHGLFRQFQVYVRAYRDARPAKPWQDRGERILVTVHPEDPDALERMFQNISERFRAPDGDPRHYEVVMHNTARPGTVVDASTDPRVALGVLMTSKPYQFEAVVRVSNERRRKVLPEFKARAYERVERKMGSDHQHPPHAQKTKHHKRDPQRRHKGHVSNKPRLSVEERNLPPIAHQLVEHIAGYMTSYHASRVGTKSTSKTAKKASRKLIRDQLFVSRAVQTAVLNDTIYKPHGANSAREYYAKRGVNIGTLINDLTTQIKSEMKGLDASAMIKRETAQIAGEMGSSSSSATSPLDQEAAKKIFKNAAIQCGLLDKFKEWTGYYGTTDDGGPDQGPSASLSFSRPLTRVASFVPRAQPVVCPPVHDRVYCDPPLVSDEPEVVEEQTGPNIITQSVVVRKSDDHHGGHHRQHNCKTHKKHYHPDSCSESSSSDDEERLMRRAHGGCTSDDSSSSDCDEGEKHHKVMVKKETHKSKDVTVEKPNGTKIHVHSEEHSNFLKVLHKSKLHFETPCLVLAPHDSVFNDQNLAAVEAAVAAGKRTYKDFVLNYVVRLPGHEHFATACSHSRAVKLVSMNGYIYELQQPGRRLVVAKKYADAFRGAEESRLRLSDKLFDVQGYPEHVKFVTLRVLHQSFPKQ